jgi:NhaP-type Na+/H+ or K+/H+ antiporter
MEHLPTLILVFGVIAGVSLLARRVAVPEPVLLALAGVIWSQLPDAPRPEIEPELVLGVFLPPLLYSESWAASWHDFRRWLRPILQLAVGLVAFTILAVAVVAHWAMPVLPWPVCFLLGAIVSPTDTVAVQSVLERLRAPRRITAILGGESLVNDATGLLGVGLATVVVITGMFEPAAIAVSFARIAGLGLALGAAVGWLAAALNQRVRGTHALFALSLVAPYAAYFLAEESGASGILAVVIAGFVSSWRQNAIAPGSRVELYATWAQVEFLLNGLMFLFIGLEAVPRLLEALESAPRVVTGAFLVSATVVAARIVWIWPAAYLPLMVVPRLR